MRVIQLSLQDLLDFQQNHVADRAKLISVVGNLSVIDTEALASFGEVQEVEIEQALHR